MTRKRLVPEYALEAPESYLQVTRKNASGKYRSRLDEHVRRLCGQLGPSNELTAVWRSLRREVDDDGAVSMTRILPTETFAAAQRAYDAEMKVRGSRGSIHSYLNVARADALLQVPEVWQLFAHPLLLALVSSHLGAPVKLVDLRGKDTEPLNVVARDNTLHLDNTPFMDELKILVSWTRGTTTGPSGQGFTYLPRTHHLYRNAFRGPDGGMMSDEDGCIFATKHQVDLALESQAQMPGSVGPRVISLTDLTGPCHTVFPASRLIHHRYRTTEGSPRSALIASFHRIDDRSNYVRPAFAQDAGYESLLAPASEHQFFEALESHGTLLVEGLDRLRRAPEALVDTASHELRGSALTDWYSRQCAGTNLGQLTAGALSNGGGALPTERAATRLRYDLQGPLNMPLFGNMREEDRKSARIAIREMSSEQIQRVADEHEHRIREFVSPLVAPLVPQARAQLDQHVAASLAALESIEVGSCADVLINGSPVTQMHPSLVRFLEDLRISVSWLNDKPSLVTAAAFALVAVHLARSWIPDENGLAELGDRIFDLYWSSVSHES